MKLVIDFSENTAYRHEYAEGHELEVIHPVLGTSICKIKDSPVKTAMAATKLPIKRQRFCPNAQISNAITNKKLICGLSVDTESRTPAATFLSCFKASNVATIDK